MRRASGFSLAEVLLATLFLCIALFGYLALHQRLIYSNWKIEQRQAPREEARSALVQRLAQARRGEATGLEPVQGVAHGLWRVRAFTTWTETVKGRSEPVEKSVHMDTFIGVRRPGW